VWTPDCTKGGNMKKIVLATFALGIASTAVPAEAAIVIGVSNDGGATITPIANDSATPGVASFIGTADGYGANISAVGSPTLTQPNFITNSINVQQTGGVASVLSVFITQTDLTSFNGSLLSSFTSNLLFGSAQSVTMATLLNPANGLFTGSPLASATFNAIGTSQSSNAVNVPGLFSETVRYDLTFGAGAGAFNDTVNIAAVPEPATWAMMLLGFAGIGVATRRRRKPVLAQVA